MDELVVNMFIPSAEEGGGNRRVRNNWLSHSFRIVLSSPYNKEWECAHAVAV